MQRHRHQPRADAAPRQGVVSLAPVFRPSHEILISIAAIARTGGSHPHADADREAELRHALRKAALAALDSSGLGDQALMVCFAWRGLSLAAHRRRRPDGRVVTEAGFAPALSRFVAVRETPPPVKKTRHKLRKWGR
jgi:hypothetical protein